MNNRGIKALKALMLLPFLLLVGCNLFNMKGEDTNTGSVKVLINSGSRNIAPDNMSFEVLMYTIEGVGRNGYKFDPIKVDPSNPSFEKGQLVVGNWTLTIKAFNSKDSLNAAHLIASETVVVEILKDQSVSKQVTLKPAGILDPTSSGVVDLKIEVPTEGSLVPVMVLDPEVGETIILSSNELKPSNGVIHLNKTLPAGVWDLNFKLLNGEIEVAGFHETLFITKGSTSSDTIYLNDIKIVEDNIFALKVEESSDSEVFIGSNIKITLKSDFAYEIAGDFEGNPLSLSKSSGNFLSSSKMIEGKSVYSFSDTNWGKVVFTFNSAYKGTFVKLNTDNSPVYSGKFNLYNEKNIKPADPVFQFIENNGSCMLAGSGFGFIIELTDNIYTTYVIIDTSQGDEPIPNQPNIVSGAYKYEEIPNILDSSKKAFKLIFYNGEDQGFIKYYFTSEYKGLAVLEVKNDQGGQEDKEVPEVQYGPEVLEGQGLVLPFSFDANGEGYNTLNNFTQNLFINNSFETDLIGKSFTMISNEGSLIDIKLNTGELKTDPLTLELTKDDYGSTIYAQKSEVLGYVNGKAIVSILLDYNASEVGHYLDIYELGYEQVIYLVLDIPNKSAIAYDSSTSLFCALWGQGEPRILQEYTNLQDDLRDQYLDMTGTLNNIVFFVDQQSDSGYVNFNPAKNGFSITKGSETDKQDSWFIKHITSLDKENKIFSFSAPYSGKMDFVLTDSNKGVVKFSGMQEYPEKIFRFNFTSEESNGYSMLKDISLSDKLFSEVAVEFIHNRKTYRFQKFGSDKVRFYSLDENNQENANIEGDSVFEIIGNDGNGNPIFYFYENTLIREAFSASQYWVLNTDKKIIQTYYDIHGYLSGLEVESFDLTGLRIEPQKFDFDPKILSFMFDVLEAEGEISGTEIIINVPYGTNVTSLEPTIICTPSATVDKTGPQDFTTPVTYTVTAEDEGQAVYTVKVNIAEDTRKEITSFSFDNDGIDSTFEISGTNINVVVPYGSNINSLTPIIEFTETATIDKTGPQNFTDDVQYTITAQDGSKALYTVKVFIKPAVNIILNINQNNPGKVTYVSDNGSSTITVTETVIFTALLNGETTGDSYSWHIDGVKQANETGPSIEIDGSKLYIGNHSLTCIINKGGNYSSTPFPFSVVADN